MPLSPPGEIMNQFMQHFIFLLVMNHSALNSINIDVKALKIEKGIVIDVESFLKNVFSMHILVPLRKFSLFYSNHFLN